jgi:small conductance mechanosensitive channel
VGALREVTAAVSRERDYAPLMLDEPSVLGVESLVPGRIVIRVTVRTRPQEQARVERELRARIKAAFDAAGIEMPTA